MTVRGTSAATWRARIALCAVLLVFLSVADGFLCAVEAPAHGATASDHAHNNGDPADTDCAYGHCHHVVPMPAGGVSTAAWSPRPVFEARLAAVLHSTDPLSLDRPPKV
jgi:hypothetical protein